MVIVFKGAEIREGLTEIKRLRICSQIKSAHSGYQDKANTKVPSSGQTVLGHLGNILRTQQ